MSRRKGPPTRRLTLRFPEAFVLDLEDAAEAHGCSLAEELMRRKPPRRQHMPMDPTTFRKLMALEPLASDPTVPVAEVVRRMEEINPYRGMYVPAEPEDEGDEIEIEWMTP